MASRVFESYWPADTLLEYLISANVLAKAGDLFTLPGRGPALKGIIKQAYDDIMDILRTHPFDPPKLSELAQRGKEYQQAIKYALESGDVYKCGSEFLFLAESWRSIAGYVKERLNTHGEFKVGDLRDRFGLSRKYAIPILEETDRIGLTTRQGDIRSVTGGYTRRPMGSSLTQWRSTEDQSLPSAEIWSAIPNLQRTRASI
jgi:selenocysteine-specific elongation factor